MGDRAIAYFKYRREYIPTTMAGDDSLRMLVFTADQVEILSNLLNYAHDRRSWNDETIDAERYYLPDDTDWDDIEAIVDDLEHRLMGSHDVGGRIQVTGNDAPASGVGVEVGYSGTYESGTIISYDRDTPEIKRLALIGFPLFFQATGAGGMQFWDSATVNDTPQTVLPSSTGTMQYGVTVVYMGADKSNGMYSGSVLSCGVGGNISLWSTTDVTIKLAVSAGGEVTVYRSAGTHDTQVGLLLLWV